MSLRPSLPGPPLPHTPFPCSNLPLIVNTQLGTAEAVGPLIPVPAWLSAAAVALHGAARTGPRQATQRAAAAAAVTAAASPAAQLRPALKARLGRRRSGARRPRSRRVRRPPAMRGSSGAVGR